MAQELKLLKLWRKQVAILEEKEKTKRDAHLAILEETLRILGQREENIQERLRIRSQSRRSSITSTQLTYYEEDSRIVNQYYRSPPPRVNRRGREREIKVDFPHFHGK